MASFGTKISHHGVDSFSGIYVPVYSNKFSVEIILPADIGNANNIQQLDLLCDAVNIPGRRITTMNDQTLHKAALVPYSFMNDELEISFKADNAGVEIEVFTQWMKKIVDEETYEVSYKNDIMSQWKIYQLNKKHEAISGYTVHGVYPIQKSAINLSNESSDLVKFTITATFDRIKKDF